MVAPGLDRFLEHCHRDGFSVHGDGEELVNEICDILNELEPQGEDELHKYWFCLDRGTIDNYYDYESMLDDGEVKNKEEYIALYEEEYPDDKKWYLLTTARHDKYATVLINYKRCFSTGTESSCMELFEWDYYKDYLLEIKDIAIDIVKKVKDGKYQEWIDVELPFKYRFGLMDSKKFWEIHPEYKENMTGMISENDLSIFTKYINEENENPINYLKKLTAADYKKILSFGYKKVYPEKTKDMSIEEMYRRNADDRDGGLSTINQNDPKVFKEWYDMPSSDKWGKYENPSHLWEAMQGSSRTRTHLIPYYIEGKGWYFVEYSQLSYCREEAALFYLGLKENNIPVLLDQGKDISNILNGNCNIGIIPCFFSTFQMAYGGFPDENVHTYVDYYDLDPKSFEYVHWMPVELI